MAKIDLDKTNNHIEEYFSKYHESENARVSRQLFDSGKEIELRTDLVAGEIPLINAMMINDSVLLNSGLKPLFSQYYNSFMKLKISLDRKSRTEFVTINRKDTSGEIVEGMKTAGTLFSSK